MTGQQNQFLDPETKQALGRSSRLDLEHVHKGGQITQGRQAARIYLPGIVQNIDRYRQIQFGLTLESGLESEEPPNSDAIAVIIDLAWSLLF